MKSNLEDARKWNKMKISGALNKQAPYFCHTTSSNIQQQFFLIYFFHLGKGSQIVTV